jgi:Domain of unknown function (DUF4338)
VNVLDAYVLGAVPPYNMLLGGKAVACLVRSCEVFDDFKRFYGNTVGIISGKRKRAELLAVTTTSSMGRSSVYNRLQLAGVQYMTSIGYTVGWGHFHIPDHLFEQIRQNSSPATRCIIRRPCRETSVPCFAWSGWPNRDH